VVADLPAKSLTDEAPIYDQPASEPAHIAAARAWDINSVPPVADSVEGSLEKLWHIYNRIQKMGLAAV